MFINQEFEPTLRSLPCRQLTCLPTHSTGVAHRLLRLGAAEGDPRQSYLGLHVDGDSVKIPRLFIIHPFSANQETSRPGVGQLCLSLAIRLCGLVY